MKRNEGRLCLENDDEEIKKEMNPVNILLEKFDDVSYILENAALSAALLHYIFCSSQEYYSLLYYYTIQKYIKVIETKNSMRNYNHINMEIYTVFIHPKSILQIPILDNELINKIEENIDSEECIYYLNLVLMVLVQEVITKYVDQFKEKIQSGLEVYSYDNKIHEDMSRIKEIKVLETLRDFIINTLNRNQKCRCLSSRKQDSENNQIFYEFQIRAITQALNTQYEYFITNRKYTYIMKHTENMSQMKTFLSNPLVKLLSKQRIKGHYFEEHSLSRATFCLVCDIILWGPHPHCLYCRNCRKAIHRDCKDLVKFCQIEFKKNKKNEILETESEKEKRNEDENPEYPNSSNLPTEVNIINEYVGNSENGKTQMSKLKEKGKPPRKLSISVLQDLKWPPSPFSNARSRKPSIKSCKSINDEYDQKAFQLKRVRSESAGSIFKDNSFNQIYDISPTLSNNEECDLASSVELILNDDDDELNVTETFEPEKELLVFSNISNKSFQKNGEYQRLLVLMEFHHKIKFTRMTLKRFKCLLVDPWIKMGEFLELYDSLSLNCIEKLYKLIGSLVSVVDACKGESSYHPSTGQRVLHWLSKEEESNLQSWLELSTDLYCTNILHDVKAGWMEHIQTSSKLNEIFSKEINRLRIIDQLSNMRSLLFNLPMIVTKIVKDLNQFDKYRDEATIWENIGHKLSHLPLLINERCMPMVHLINDGVILTSTFKYKRYKSGTKHYKKMETFFNNFPKTVFKNKFFDFQFVKISNLRESPEGESKLMQSSVYVKEEIDAAAICYEKEMILLQKENGKYILKQFKSSDTHKLLPMIEFDQIHATKQTIKEKKHFQYELTMLIVQKAILAQILFEEEEKRDIWFDHIKKTQNTTQKDHNIQTMEQLPCLNPSNENSSEVQELSSDSAHSRMSRIKHSFDEAAIHFRNTLDLISKELSVDEIQNNAEKLQRMKTNDPNSPNEFMYNFVKILNEYIVIGGTMMEESSSVDSTQLLQKDILLVNLSKIKSITDQMKYVLHFQRPTSEESDASIEHTVEEKGVDPIQSFDIHCYINGIIEDVHGEIQSDIKAKNYNN